MLAIEELIKKIAGIARSYQAPKTAEKFQE
jgi:hypothetical protein